VVRFSSLFRDVVGQLWDDQTAHANYRSLDDMPESYGQCVPASCLLFEQLERRFPEERFELVSGIVYLLGKTVLNNSVEIKSAGAHVWIGWHQYNVQDTGIIDVTSDQLVGTGLSACTIATNEELLEGSVVYQAGRMFASVQELEAQFALRELDVAQRIDLLRDRYDGYFQYDLHGVAGVATCEHVD
jgi:hypothetical protein